LATLSAETFNRRQASTLRLRARGMVAGEKSKQLSMITRLLLTIAGVLLMVGPPYAFEMLNLTPVFQKTMMAGMMLLSLAVGFVLLYLALRGRESG